MKKSIKRPAIYVESEEQRNAFAVLDEIDGLELNLKTYRAVEALAGTEAIGNDEGLSMLRRSDLGSLLLVLNMSAEHARQKARDCAAEHAKSLGARDHA